MLKIIFKFLDYDKDIILYGCDILSNKLLNEDFTSDDSIQI